MSLIAKNAKIDEFNSNPKSLFKRLLKSLLKRAYTHPFLGGCKL